MNCKTYETIRAATMAVVFSLFLICAIGCADEAIADMNQQSPVRIEMTRELPNNETYIVVREFDDLEELLMWYENKVESQTCDPYVTKIEMYPYGKDNYDFKK
jgi:hypothetical protein